jgi:hypothetical protein
MASSYTSSLGLVLPVQGELSGTWGDTVNNYLTTYVDTAVAGQLAISLTANVTLTKSTGTSLGSTSSQYAILNVTPSASTWTITAPAASKTYYINNLSSSFTFTFKASGQTGFVVAAAEKCVVAYNGTDFVRVSSTSVFGSPSTAMTLDTSGNLGIGVTPSAWSQGKAMELLNPGYGIWNGSGSPASMYMLANAYYNSGFKYGGTGQASHYYQYQGQHIWSTATSGTAGNAITFTQAMTLDSSGNLGIGTSSPTTKLDVSSSGTTTLRVNRLGVADVYLTAGANSIYGLDTASTNLGFGVNNSLKMTLDSSGNLLVGTTVAYAKTVSISSDGVLAGVIGINDFSGVGCVDSWNRATSGNNTFSVFGTETSFTTRGSITYNRAGGLVVYNTTSDYRAKDIIGPVQDSGATIDALKVYEGQMKDATQSRPMLIAHEAQAVTPYAVTGEKDAVKEDGTPDYQQMDVSSLVPLLIAEVQSLRIRISQLEAK